MLGFHNKDAFSTPMFPIDYAHHQGFPLLWFADDTPCRLYDQHSYFPGTAYSDVTCEPCRGGFFSADSSSRKSCQKFTVCTPDRTTIPGDDRHDVYCSACKSGSITQEGERLMLI